MGKRGKGGGGAYLEITIGGDAKTVARTTEMIGHAARTNGGKERWSVMGHIYVNEEGGDVPGDETDSATMTRHTPVLGSIVGIVSLAGAFESRELRPDGLDEIAIRYKLLHLPLVAVERHVLANRHAH